MIPEGSGCQRHTGDAWLVVTGTKRHARRRRAAELLDGHGPPGIARTVEEWLAGMARVTDAMSGDSSWSARRQAFGPHRPRVPAGAGPSCPSPGETWLAMRSQMADRPTSERMPIHSGLQPPPFDGTPASAD